MEPAVQRSTPEDLVVGAAADVGAHNGLGIAEAGVVLHAAAAESIGVVGEPDLGHVAEHAGVRTIAAGGAGFKEDLREPLRQYREDLVEPQNIAVPDLTLTLRRQSGGKCIGENPIHVPLDVGQAWPG